ncbi:hypothetical protein IGI04_015488 [Brassica rapa subsp. trilocularis]|uniref:FKB95-like N-terminal Kelch domain-containing protein n=1 Tax=Brassica rapa subsp. trilocularis TaxID=1813537 RepID=A0ABQ7MT62_BRACM|nr:hypothetical protein IGI04_015488 [Brassica rapa subsp. trilocularis]
MSIYLLRIGGLFIENDELVVETQSRGRWFVLCQRPKPNQEWSTSKNTNDNLLIPIPIPSTDSHSAFMFSKFVAVGSNIYCIRSLTTEIMFLDCRFHTWHEAPNILWAQTYPFLNVLDGKISVARPQREYDGCQMLVHLLSMSKWRTMLERWREEIWCAEIALERRNEHEMWGKIEWFGKVPLDTELGNIVVATV